MKLLYIDMDGVVADFDHAIQTHLPGLDTSIPGDPKTLNKRADAVDKLCEENPYIFHDLKPIDGSIKYVKKLFPLFEIYFLSTPMWNVPLSWAGKREWIDDHFGKLAHKRLILTHRKDLNMGDFLVDDRKTNGVDRFTGEHIHFGTPEFPDWSVVYNYLIKNK